MKLAIVINNDVFYLEFSNNKTYADDIYKVLHTKTFPNPEPERFPYCSYDIGFYVKDHMFPVVTSNHQYTAYVIKL